MLVLCAATCEGLSLAHFISLKRPHVERAPKDIRGPNPLGTAVNVQSMVCGNMGETNCTGVSFSRNPATGEKKIYGEFLMNAQGEDIVAGIRTPQDIQQLHEVMPAVGEQLFGLIEKLEQHFHDMQDIEFTVEQGKLYIRQTRNGKRTAMAAVNVVVDMFDEGLVSKEQALLHLRIDPTQQMPKPLDSYRCCPARRRLTAAISP